MKIGENELNEVVKALDTAQAFNLGAEFVGYAIKVAQENPEYTMEEVLTEALSEWDLN